MSIYSYDGEWLQPGQLPTLETIEQDLTSVIWQPLRYAVVGANRPILGTATDDGNVPKDILRPGLLLTKTSDGKAFTTWGSVVDKSTDKIEGILLIAMKMNTGATPRNRFNGHILLGGFAKVDGIIVPGNSSAGITGDVQESNIRTQLKYTIRFDDDPFCHKA